MKAASDNTPWIEKVRAMMAETGRDFYACCRELGRHGGKAAAAARAKRRRAGDPGFSASRSVADLERRKLF